jgi:hypothetical protein
MHTIRFRYWTWLFALFGLVGAGSLLPGAQIKTVVNAPDLVAVTTADLMAALGYKTQDAFPLTLDADSGCPFVQVNIGAHAIDLMLDTGTARGLLLTDHAPRVPYRELSRSEELNADGSHRGWSRVVELDAMEVLGQRFANVHGALAEWTLFASTPFNGTIGLDFFMQRRLTLDYRQKQVWVSTAPLPRPMPSQRYLILDLIEPPAAQGHVLYANAMVNGHEAIVYFDTGYNLSWIDPAFASDLPLVEREGRYRLYRQRVPLVLGGHHLMLDEVRENTIRRGSGFSRRVAMILGSDFLAHFAVTVDLRARQLILAWQG